MPLLGNVPYSTGSIFNIKNDIKSSDLKYISENLEKHLKVIVILWQYL